MQRIYGVEADNRISGSNEECNIHILSSYHNTNITEDNMAILRCILITIDD